MNHILQSHPIVKPDIQRAQGCYLYDSQGKCYIDFEAGVWCTGLGHNHSRVNQTICAQINQVTHLGYRYSCSHTEEAAVAVLESAGIENGKCTFLNSGSEAVEFAVQAARRICRRPLLLTLTDAYLAAYGSAGRQNPQEWYVFDWGACTGCANSEACENCRQFNSIPFDQIGGLVFEPGNSHGLVKLPPVRLIQAIEQQIKAQGGMLVIDEITTGIGRTGRWYGFQHYSVTPDIIAVGKCIGNGYPVSAVLFTAESAAQWQTTGLQYAQSHQNDPLGSAVVREVISIMHDENLAERSRETGSSFLETLQALRRRCPVIKDVRGRGLMIALELKTSKEGISAEEVYYSLLGRGLIVGLNPAANLLRFYPPLTISSCDIQELLNGLETFLT